MDVLTERTCPDCHGTGCGRLPDDCTTCNGMGAVPSEQEHPVTIRDTPEAMQAVADAALHVTKNVHRQGVPHTRGPDGNCGDDCVPCWAARLWAAVVRTEAGQAAFLADTGREHWLASER